MSAHNAGTPDRVPHLPISLAADAGIVAHMDGEPLAANPFVPGTPEHAAWGSAWLIQDEIARAYPDDAVEGLLREAQTEQHMREQGLTELCERVQVRALLLTRFLSFSAPVVVVEEGRASLRRAVDQLLAREPEQPGGAS